MRDGLRLIQSTTRRGARMKGWLGASGACLLACSLCGCGASEECRAPVPTPHRTVASLKPDERADALRKRDEVVAATSLGRGTTNPLDITLGRLEAESAAMWRRDPYARFVSDLNDAADVQDCLRSRAFLARHVAT